MPIDPYDCREKTSVEKERWRGRPDVLAVYEIIRAFNRHRHESAPLADVKAVLEREVQRLRRYPRSLRRQTESALAQDRPLTPAEYEALMLRWFEHKRDLEEGVTLLPYLFLLVILLVILAIVVLIAQRLLRG